MIDEFLGVGLTNVDTTSSNVELMGSIVSSFLGIGQFLVCQTSSDHPSAPTHSKGAGRR